MRMRLKRSLARASDSSKAFCVLAKLHVSKTDSKQASHLSIHVDARARYMLLQFAMWWR